MLIAFGISSIAQNTYVNQVLIGAGGNYSNPDENVTVSTYSPNDQSITSFGDVLTHSIQDIVIYEGYVYVAAQDSIAKFDIDTYERIAIASAPGVNQLYAYDGNLFVSFQFPVTENFVRVYSSDDLSFITNIAEVSNESAGMLVVDNNLYVAVPGGWASTTGNVAIISLPSYELTAEVDLGAEGIGVFDLFSNNDKIMTINRTPYLGTTGYISTMTLEGTEVEAHLFNEVIGKFAGCDNDLLYTVMNNGIGSINLTDFTVENTEIVMPLTNTIAAVALDTVNNLFYLTTTDYFSMGEGSVYNMGGQILNTFDAAISSEAIDIDYRVNTGIVVNNINKISVYPNPATTSISFNGNYDNYNIVDLSGRIIASDNIHPGMTTINIEALHNGMYIINLTSDSKNATATFIKK